MVKYSSLSYKTGLLKGYNSTKAKQ